jgi:hypothetical protein
MQALAVLQDWINSNDGIMRIKLLRRYTRGRPPGSREDSSVSQEAAT